MPTPVKLTIKFKADTLEEFVERYGVYVSQGGIFVRTKKPLSVGSLVDFEFKMQNGGALLKGMGTVVWTREHDPARRGAPAGMGLRYDSLDDESISILTRILSLKGSETSGEAEAPAEAGQVTSPGQQQEKTRVASMDVLNALRESVHDEAVAGEVAGSQPKPVPLDLDAPVDLDAPLSRAGARLDLERPMDELPPLPESKKSMDEESTPLPQAAAPLLPMSEIREPFDLKQTLKREADDDGGAEEEIPTAVAKVSDLRPESAPAGQDSAPAGQETAPAGQPAASEEVSDVLAELKEMSSKSVVHEDGDTGGLRLPRPIAETEADGPEIPHPHLEGKHPQPAGKELDDKELFDEIDNALMKGKPDPATAGAAVPVVKDRARDAEPAKKTPVRVYEEESKGGAGLWIVLVILLLALAGGGFYYWKFMRPAKDDGGGTHPGSDPVMGPETGPQPVMAMEPGMEPDPAMVVEPGMVPEPAMVVEPGMDPEPVKDATPVEPGMDPEPAMGMEPLVIAPPDMAPDKTCAADEFPVAVTSVPGGASLVVNLEKVPDTTPATLCLKSGRGYTIAFEHPDYLPVSEFIPKLTQKTDVHRQLVTYPRRLLIQSDPKGATVFIDGEKVGATTISKTFPTVQELWKVELKAPGHKDEVFEIRLDDPKWIVRGRVKSFEIFKKLQKIQ